jgi:hypothetical protein
LEEARRLAGVLASYVNDFNGEGAVEVVATDKWVTEMDRFVRLGPPGGKKGLEPQQVERYLKHIFEGEGGWWRPQVQSPSAARRHYTTIRGQWKVEHERAGTRAATGSGGEAEWPQVDAVVQASRRAGDPGVVYRDQSLSLKARAACYLARMGLKGQYPRRAWLDAYQGLVDGWEETTPLSTEVRVQLGLAPLTPELGMSA